jgi:hypothetical protein
VAGAVLLFATAGIHLYLWVVGYRDIDGVGPLFLLDAAAAVVLGLGVLVTRRRWLGAVAVLGALLQVGTLGGLILSVWVGIFGFVESTSAALFWPSVFVELAGAVVLAELAAEAFTDSRRGRGMRDRAGWD